MTDVASTTSQQNKMIPRKWDDVDPNNPIHIKCAHIALCNFIKPVILNKLANPGTTIKKTSTGVTDVTYLVTVTTETYGNLHRVSIILKLSLPHNSRNAEFSGKIFNILGMQTPKFIIFDGSYQLTSLIQKYTKDFTTLTERSALLTKKAGELSSVVTKTFPGATLKDTIRLDGRIFLLSNTAKQHILKIFGKIAVFDLLIGNDDRFYNPLTDRRFDCNSGNVLLDIQHEQDAWILKDIFCIDNVSSKRFDTKDDQDYLAIVEVFTSRVKELLFRNNIEFLSNAVYDSLNEELFSTESEDDECLYLSKEDALESIQQGIILAKNKIQEAGVLQEMAALCSEKLISLGLHTFDKFKERRNFFFVFAPAHIITNIHKERITIAPSLVTTDNDVEEHETILPSPSL